MSESTAEDDLMHRRLCPDGGCIGLVGPDGRCKECGMVDETVVTDPRLRGHKTPAIEDSSWPESSQDDEEEEEEQEVDEEAGLENDGDAIEGEFADRRLCPDGGCLGVIGPDGSCKECGTVL